MSTCNSEHAIRTHSGLFVEPLDIDRDNMRIEDIAHALSNQCRFSGHTAYHYSVAQHSVLVVWILERLLGYTDRETLLWGLLHDAAEAYLVDLPRPIKRHEDFAAYREAEIELQEGVSCKFDLDCGCPPEAVHQADDIALRAEANVLMHGTKDWTAADGGRTIGLDELRHVEDEIRRMDPEDAKADFIATFLRLF